MLLNAQVNKTKIAIFMVAILFAAVPLYFANAGWIEDTFYDMVVFLFGGLVGLCGAVLNYGVQHFVVGFSDEFNSTALFATINSIWTLIRDLFNITFIFGLVYIGFTMILKSDSGNTRKLLVNIVIAALLVNFSLLISKLVIDASNMTAVQILNAGLSSTPNQIFVLDSTNNGVDFAASMMNQLGIGTLFKNGTVNTTAVGTSNAPTDGKSLGYSMILILVFLITAFTFLSAGIMIIIRGAMLVLFMVFSPLMFIGLVIPKFMKITDQYWKEFIARALFAPVYILIVYVGLSVFDAVRIQTNGVGSTTMNGAFSPNGFGAASNVEMAFGPFALFVVLMVASLNIAKQLGVEGAASAMSIAGNARKQTVKGIRNTGMYAGRKTTQAASAATIGVGSAAMRHTLGRMSYNYTNSDKGKKLAAGGFASRQAAAVMKGLGNASYDPRSSKKDGMLGKSRTGGYAGHIEREEKKDKQRSKDLERSAYDHEGNRNTEFAEKLKADTQYQEAEAAHAEAENNLKTKSEAYKSERANLKEFNDAVTAMEQMAKNGDAELTLLKTKLASTTDPVERKDTEEEINLREKAIIKNLSEDDSNYKSNKIGQAAAQERLKEAQTNLVKSGSAITEAEKKKKAEEARVEGTYKYEFVKELKETRRNERTMWQKAQGATVGATASFGTAGAIIGLAAGPVGAAVGASVGAAIGAAIRGTIKKEVETAEARIGAITEVYGKGFDKKEKRKGAIDLAKALREAEKEEGVTPSAEAT